MLSGLRKCGFLLTSISVIAICSCEKHSLGELPEVQKEHVSEKSVEKKSSEEKASTPSPTPAVTPTPAEFFPEHH